MKKKKIGRIKSSDHGFDFIFPLQTVSSGREATKPFYQRLCGTDRKNSQKTKKE